MLEVISMNFIGANVRKENEGMPSNIEVSINIDAISKESDEELRIEWSYVIDYKPDIGVVRLTGDVFCHDTPANINKVVEAFAKKKEFPPELGTNVLNMINANASINAIFIIRPFNLLPPFTPPPLVGEEKKK